MYTLVSSKEISSKLSPIPFLPLSGFAQNEKYLESIKTVLFKSLPNKVKSLTKS